MVYHQSSLLKTKVAHFSFLRLTFAAQKLWYEIFFIVVPLLGSLGL